MTDATRTDALFTDFYELTMAQAFHAEGMNATATFELYFRKPGGERNYIVACGLDAAAAFLEDLHFAPRDIDYLAALGTFSGEFLDRLAALRFTGDAFAVPEGTVVFSNEPVLQIVAPLIEAQLIETYLLNQVHFASLAASKAARVVSAAAGRPVIDFGARRAHGTDAAIKAARAGYVAGLAGTSNVAAGARYGIPLYGTMAHSYIQAHATEAAALEAFTRCFPNTTVLVDTYDTLNGVRAVIQLAGKSGSGFSLGGIRIDSGDLGELSRQARNMLDAAGLNQVKIVASGGLDEYKVRELAREAPVDAFGVGTDMVVSADRPYLDCAYKLVEYAGLPRIKTSASKTLLPGRKQVFRRRAGATFCGDVIALNDESADGEPLLAPLVRGGRRVGPGTSLKEQRDHCRRALAALPAPLRELEKADADYAVEVSPALRDLRRRMLETDRTD